MDKIKKVCEALDIRECSVVTFDDYLSKIKNEFILTAQEIDLMRCAWNASCESLLSILRGIDTLTGK